MTRLLRDRYVMFDEARGCDLVTGEEVLLDSLDDGRSTPESQPPTPNSGWNSKRVAVESWELAISEMLQHGRDGHPRWIVVDARNGLQAAAVGRQVAEEGRRHGFVAMAVDIYLRLRDLLTEDFADRTLLLIGRCVTADAASRAALVEASAQAARPHVLLTFRCTAGPIQACQAREARVAYGAAGARSLKEAAAPGLVRYLEYIDKAEAFLREGRHAAGERLLRETAGALGRRRAFGLSARALTTLGRLLLERGRAADADCVLDHAARDAAAAQDEAAGLRPGCGRRQRDATASGSRMRSPCVGRCSSPGRCRPLHAVGRKRSC